MLPNLVVDPNRPKKYVVRHIEWMIDRVEAPGAGHMEMAGAGSPDADIVDDVLAAAMLLQYFREALRSQRPLLLDLLAEVDGAGREGGVVAERLTLKIFQGNQHRAARYVQVFCFQPMGTALPGQLPPALGGAALRAGGSLQILRLQELRPPSMPAPYQFPRISPPCSPGERAASGLVQRFAGADDRLAKIGSIRHMACAGSVVAEDNILYRRFACAYR
jgi:hypothetical protein